ncbi:glucans biosynthesis protein C, partial [Klebsiella aerogenes]|uniref:glucans biosynthesis protein C n=1 Tax=Klebsiella aerogenes TaxID=548 RepID=UPI002DB7879A
NTLAWELISHLWFLLVLVVLTTLGVVLFKWLANRGKTQTVSFVDTVTFGQLSLIFLGLGVLYAVIRRTIFIVYPPILSNGLFNFIVMQTLFYLPFFVLGAQTFINPRLKAMFTTSSPWCFVGALLGFIAYRLNQQYGSGDGWMYETESVITMVLGLWMVNVVFSLGHRLLNFQSARVTYFVNASLFIYLVHHPLTLLYGAWITPIIKSNLLGFITGLVFVVGIALVLYEIHLRIPLLRFLFSGKPQQKPAKAPVSVN